MSPDIALLFIFAVGLGLMLTTFLAELDRHEREVHDIDLTRH